MPIRKKILYFGLDPSRLYATNEVVHFPLIRTKPFVFEAVQDFFAVPHSHVLFTSRTAVTYYFQYTDVRAKRFICVGKATAARLAEFGVQADQIAKDACAEGVISVLKELKCDHILYPHAAQARRLLPDYLEGVDKKGTAFALYDTFPNAETLPDLTQFKQLVFTSPSIVNVFSTLCLNLPPQEKCVAIGPITQNALNKLFDSSMTTESSTLKHEENNG